MGGTDKRSVLPQSAAAPVSGRKAKEGIHTEYDFSEKTCAAESAEFGAQAQNEYETMRDYYFHWTGKLNQSYVLETPAREAVYEAICDHIGVLRPYRYTFINRKTGTSRQHKVSHTVTTGSGNGMEDSSFFIVESSRFKIDDVDNWEYLNSLGYSVEPKRSGIRLNFDVLHHGVPVAFLEAAGVNILKDGAKNPLGDKLPGTGLYKVSCMDADLEAVFMACFCVSRVEFC